MLAALNTPVLESIEGLLHWNIQKDMDSDIMDVLNTLYIITVTPESEKLNQSIFETSNISLYSSTRGTTSVWWLEAALGAVHQPQFISE